jgi:hypothetical protein
MRKAWTLAILIGIAAVVGAARVVTAHPQIELDRIVARVGGRIITQSDVRQARMLKLVDDTSSDETTRRGLEERILILTEIGRSGPLAPAADGDIAERRREWESSLGSPDVAGLLRQGGMSEADLQTWLRDDVRIRAYTKRQFGALPDADRGRARSDWIGRLRGRAGVD